MFEETSRRLGKLVETKVLGTLPREKDDLASG
jgi:hypothetical protein